MINQRLKAATLREKITQQAIAKRALHPNPAEPDWGEFSIQTQGCLPDSPVGVTRAIAQGALAEAIAELQEFIALRPDAREVRKALAVKLVYQGYLYEEIQTILDVSLGSITGWKQAYEEHGIDGLRLNHKGRKSYLNVEQREEVLSWLQTKDSWELGELEYKLAFEYDVTYESKRSYYNLFDAAGISWKKTTKLNPKTDPDAVAAKKKRLKHCWQGIEKKSKQEY